ncbi:GNAT family N-acetyltransferase [Streptomyces sp. NPDC048751]|uniref:GNAT family N-acetyltransferase n=1 Tax=Streptomyces sp. NPDC048751 TaxID=3365591 RepID=UPI00371D737F
MRDMGAQRLEEAAASCVALLRTVEDRDWEGTRASRLEWSCRRTALHIAEALMRYSGQLAARAQERYVPFELPLDEAPNGELLRAVETTQRLLCAVIRTTPAQVRAYHPYPFGSANPEGFAAMGVAEMLLHTHDIAESLGVAYEPPAELPEFVLTRIFPHVRPDTDRWRTLLWATGRGDLPDRAPLTDWRWNNNIVLPTDRLTLQGVTPAAAADLAAGGDGGFDWAEGGPFEGTREAAGMVTKAYEGGVHRPEFGLFVLLRRDDGRAVGGMGFHGVPDEDGRAEVGYDLVEAARGKGYATEALRALAGWALAHDEVTALIAVIDRGNTPSRRVVSRAGFVEAGASGADGVDETETVYELRG